MLGAHDGVVLVAHGTVGNLDDLPEFLRRIRRGHPPSPELVAELRRRYEAIGGQSPLLDITRRQAVELARRLEAPVLVGMRLWEPSVERALAAGAELGVSRIVLVPLAPFSVHVYAAAAERALDALRAELGARALTLVHVAPYGTHPAFVAAHVSLIAEVLSVHPEFSEAPLVLTAHSLPKAVIDSGDPYGEQVAACAAAISSELGRAARLVYQSAGTEGGLWLGPDVGAVLSELAAAGARRAVVAPFGFLAEHVETLYDLDIDARQRASALGLELLRIPTLDARPALIEALAQVTTTALSRPESGSPR
jgi:ferrochelatase